jgi:hypothetical protein
LAMIEGGRLMLGVVRDLGLVVWRVLRTLICRPRLCVYVCAALYCMEFFGCCL